jgi:hypothetical protein
VGNLSCTVQFIRIEMIIKCLKVLEISVLRVFGQLSYESSAVYRVLCSVCVRVRASMRVPAFKFKVVLRGSHEEYAIL